MGPITDGERVAHASCWCVQILPIEQRLQDRTSFGWLMALVVVRGRRAARCRCDHGRSRAQGLITAFYVAFGVIGCFIFGSHTSSTITANLGVKTPRPAPPRRHSIRPAHAGPGCS
jgi:hypothetical protein